MTPHELKQILSHGLLSFPVTDFDAQGDFQPGTYAERLEWLAPYGATALFAAGGTGEFFSLTPTRTSAHVIKTAVDTCRGKVPILAGAGGPTAQAIAYAQEAERLGAARRAAAAALPDRSLARTASPSTWRRSASRCSGSASWSTTAPTAGCRPNCWNSWPSAART